MTRALHGLVALVLGVSLVTAGCSGQQGADRPATYAVTGIVTHNGKPVEGAMVKFELADGSRSAVGKTDASGKYTLTTFGSDDGALPGSYKVSIVQYETPPITPAKSEAEYVPPEMLPASAKPAPPRNLLPSKYADVKSSNLTATVTENGENKFDFNLQ